MPLECAVILVDLQECYVNITCEHTAVTVSFRCLLHIKLPKIKANAILGSQLNVIYMLWIAIFFLSCPWVPLIIHTNEAVTVHRHVCSLHLRSWPVKQKHVVCIHIVPYAASCNAQCFLSTDPFRLTRYMERKQYRLVYSCNTTELVSQLWRTPTWPTFMNWKVSKQARIALVTK